NAQPSGSGVLFLAASLMETKADGVMDWSMTSGRTLRGTAKERGWREHEDGQQTHLVMCDRKNALKQGGSQTFKD
ncbi:hypothetical protein, partial [Corynebacterium casei]|uniref:hypothetical protein n=1 Tax=Corynebacterium casei TaxID=160386 RepID=UPI003F8F7BAA